jgi:hypothetical protein
VTKILDRRNLREEDLFGISVSKSQIHGYLTSSAWENMMVAGACSSSWWSGSREKGNTGRRGREL